MKRSDVRGLASPREARQALPRLVAGALVGVSLLLGSSAASAYCRTANCSTHKGAWQVCSPKEADDCGTELFWPNRCVGFTLQKDASKQVGLNDAETIFTAAFDTWMKADCGGGKHPSIQLAYQGPVVCHTQEYNKEKGNANIIMFDDGSWPYEGTANILALTTVTYNLDSSEIYDADMEINSHDIADLTTGDGAVKFDMLSIATHETGHFLGLAHSHSTDATMFSSYMQGSVSLRDLTADDVASICAAYPPDMPHSQDCDDTPRHGFASECAADQAAPAKGCSTSVAAPGTGRASTGLFALAGALSLALLRRKRRRA